MRPRDLICGGSLHSTAWHIQTDRGAVSVFAELSCAGGWQVEAFAVRAPAPRWFRTLAHFVWHGSRVEAVAHCVGLLVLDGVRVLDVEAPIPEALW